MSVYQDRLCAGVDHGSARSTACGQRWLRACMLNRASIIKHVACTLRNGIVGATRAHEHGLNAADIGLAMSRIAAQT